ncbi:hypothetical protein DP113_04825 [Brasilonema octagenarum UFV-E1]|uniref:Uncharacterized protein n=2 Tax=Brasilonema TaxID=383614 RepID=A0A856M852_9CYAN|nr:hypothetical protein [Brasilonema octagenarum UFV-OR1]QDL07325.1 hypothetical protein DP114_04875 [Brasilonema sennae CENA114]QDL13689.1 hypothetical protein DP113_04825 [Brasilonema octagenarum UFV-E1]
MPFCCTLIYAVISRHGRAKILTQQEIQLVFTIGFNCDRDKTFFVQSELFLDADIEHNLITAQQPDS